MSTSRLDRARITRVRQSDGLVLRRAGFGVAPKRTFAVIIALGLRLISPTAAPAEKLALVRGTVINPADEKVMPNAVVVIDGNHIAEVGADTDIKFSPGPKVIDCAGKFILPGYIDTHAHFFQSADLFTRPDVVV